MKIDYVPTQDFYILPAKSTKGAAGYDIFSTKDFKLEVGEKIRIPIGICMAFSDRFELVFRTRSGIDWTYDVHQTVSTIDSDVRSSPYVILRNNGKSTFYAKRGDAIAQMIGHRIGYLTFKPVNELPVSERGNNGFGHTGMPNQPPL